MSDDQKLTDQNISDQATDQPVSEPENQNIAEPDNQVAAEPQIQDDSQPEEIAVTEAPESTETSDAPASSDETETIEPAETAQPAQTETEEEAKEVQAEESSADQDEPVVEEPQSGPPGARWYVVHTYSGHENRVAQALKQRVESERLENKILDVLVPTQEKIEIRSGKKETVKEKIFPGYILVRMVLDDDSWLAIRTTQGVTSFVGANNKPTPIPDVEVRTIVKFMEAGGQPTYKQIFSEGDTVKIVDGPFSEFIGKIDTIDKERGKVKVLVSIFGRETPVELDFLQVAKL